MDETTPNKATAEAWNLRTDSLNDYLIFTLLFLILFAALLNESSNLSKISLGSISALVAIFVTMALRWFRLTRFWQSRRTIDKAVIFGVLGVLYLQTIYTALTKEDSLASQSKLAIPSESKKGYFDDILGPMPASRDASKPQQ